MPLAFDIRAVHDEHELAGVRTLWCEYWDSLGLAPEFQGFANEVQTLPGAYGKAGGLLLAGYDGATPAGTAALRRLSGEACEAKRLYVLPRYRGLGLGEALIRRLIAEARGMSYRTMYGDTLPSMTGALAMYRRIGFEEIGPYSATPTPGAVYLKLALGRATGGED